MSRQENPSGEPNGSRPAWIEVIPETEAVGELAALYDELRSPQTGRVDHVMAIHSLHPAVDAGPPAALPNTDVWRGRPAESRARDDRRGRLSAEPLPLLTAASRGRSRSPHRTNKARTRPIASGRLPHCSAHRSRASHLRLRREAHPLALGDGGSRSRRHARGRSDRSRHPGREHDHELLRVREQARGWTGHSPGRRRRRPGLVSPYTLPDRSTLQKCLRGSGYGPRSD
jgi:hypothetical protein